MNNLNDDDDDDDDKKADSNMESSKAHRIILCRIDIPSENSSDIVFDEITAKKVLFHVSIIFINNSTLAETPSTGEISFETKS